MNEKKLQVLLISSWYPNKLRPLLGIFFKRHASAIAELCEVSSVYVFASDEPSVEEVVEDGVHTIRIGYKRVKNVIPLVSQVIKMRRYFSAYKRAVALYGQKKGKPDIIHLNVVFPSGIVARYFHRKWNVPYVVEEQWTGYFEEDGRYQGFLMKAMTRRVIKSASAVITISNDLKSKMLEHGLVNDYHVISNVVDTELFNIAKVGSDNKTRFIHVSTLDDVQKNVSGIIRCFHKLHTKFPDTELTIVGDGPDKAMLEGLSSSIGLTDCIHFVGQKTKQDLVGLYQKANAFVLFSNYETQAIVLLESLCCGRPVIATRTGGIQEYVNSKNGILIDAKNEGQLVQAMTTIVKDKDRFADSVNIRASVVDKVNSEAIAKQFVSVYNKVLNRQQ